ncbi:MAG TPA: PAS domain S-box protein [Rhizomicrobium sp.]|nr:PAS domain S-box protein [Rhizomicrobium sp.]
MPKLPSKATQFETDRQNSDDVAQQLAAIVESSDDAIISKDLDGIIMSWNRGAQRIFGYEVDEAIGKPVTILMPPDRLDEEPGILARIRAGERIDHYETVRRRKDGTFVDISLSVSPVRNAQGKIVGASKIARDITNRKKMEKHRELLMAELSHRVKNTLAIVLSIERLSFSGQQDNSANRAFRARIQALAHAHGRLAEAQWLGVALQHLIEDELAPYRRSETSNTSLSGPLVILSPRCALNMALAIHELATNAAKHGALSAPRGRVIATWERTNDGVLLEWREQGGPAISSPRRKGFGHLLLEQALQHELGSNVSMDFRPEGLKCTILIPNQELESLSG